MEIRRLTKASEVIDALGGNKPFAEIVSTRKKPRVDQHVSNYRRIGFPPDTYLVVTEALHKIGCVAPPSLWKITEPKQSRKVRRAS